MAAFDNPANVMAMMRHVKTPEDEAMAQEIIRAMLSGTNPTGVIPAAPAQAAAPVASATLDIGSVQAIRNLLGGGATPYQGDPLSQFGSVQEAQAMLGGAARPRDQVVNNRNPLQEAQARAFDLVGGVGQIQSVDAARAMLGGAARPADKGPFEQKTAGMSRIEQALITAASAEQDSRLAAVLDAQALSFDASQEQKDLQQKEKPKGPTSKEGTVEWVNADGIAKVKQKNGSTLFTNVQDAEGGYTSAYMGEKPKDHTPLGKPVSLQIKDQLDQVRNAADSGTAQMLASTLNSSIAAEYSRMENDAYSMAAKELGVDALNRSLVAQRSMDTAQRAYNPAMGDSAETIKLRQQISTAEQMAKNRANEWLGRNIGYQQLKATENEAKVAVDLAVKKKAAQEGRIELIDKRAQDKLDQAEAKALTTLESMPSSVRMLAVKINPDFAKPGSEAKIGEFLTRELKTNKEFVAVAQADPVEYPALAFSGNKLAKDLLLKDESAATGISEEELAKEFKDYGEMPASDADVRAWAERTITAANPAEKKAAVDSFISQYNTTKMATGKEGMKQRTEIEAKLKIARVKAGRQNRMTEDVMSWVPAGSPMAEAAKKAKEITGKASLRETLAILTKDKPLPEQMAIYKEARESMLQAAKKYDGSMYGGIDSGALVNNFNQTALNMAQLSDSFRAMLGNMPFMGLPAGMAYDAMNADMYKTLMK